MSSQAENAPVESLERALALAGSMPRKDIYVEEGVYEPERVAVGDADAVPTAFQIRFSRMVHIGDRFSLRWWDREFPDDPGFDEPHACVGRPVDTAFETLNQRGETTCSGALRVASGSAPPLPEPLPIEPWSRHDVAEALHADDMVARGPRGVSAGRTLGEADLVAWAGFTAEQNPLYLNEEFARAGRFGARIAPPMLTFCLAFGDYLRDLLSIRMPSAGFAGHLGDSWRFFAPVHVGDTIRVRHKPVACARSKSRPEMGIVRFALQVENQRGEIVQDGRVAMMMPAGAD